MGRSLQLFAARPARESQLSPKRRRRVASRLWRTLGGQLALDGSGDLVVLEELRHPGRADLVGEHRGRRSRVIWDAAYKQAARVDTWVNANS